MDKIDFCLRDSIIRDWHKDGYSLSVIAAQFHISKQRVHQIVRGKYPVPDGWWRQDQIRRKARQFAILNNISVADAYEKFGVPYKNRLTKADKSVK